MGGYPDASDAEPQLRERAKPGEMKRENTAPAKITRPTIPGAIRRERLFDILDDRIQKPVLWISSPAGSGKTALVSDYLLSRRIPCIWYQCDEGDSDLATFFYYMGLAAKKAMPGGGKPLPVLTSEYLSGIPTFTRRYFEKLCSCLLSTARRGCAIVFDNHQNVPADSPFHDMLATGFNVLAEGVHAVVISRGEPPSAFARLQANDKIGLLDYRDVRFTLEESQELLRRRIPDLDSESIRAIHGKTQGWVAGMILLQERATITDPGVEPAEDGFYDRVFDYFAGEILNRAERKLEAFLMRTAFLPALSVPQAGRLTGAGDAGRILSTLNRQNFFTERLEGSGEDYQYHPLFRDFLLNRAKAAFSPWELAAIQREAASLLEQSGRIEEAAKLSSDAGDGHSLARMTVRHARALLMQGRSRTVQEWIACIPREIADRDPWLLFWNGMASFPSDMRSARKHLETAFRSFKAMDEVSGIYLSWAGIVDTYAFELEEWRRLDHCIAVFENLRKSYPSFPSKEVDLYASSRMLISLTLRRTHQPRRVEQWLERVTALLKDNPSADIQMDTVFCMSLYYLWKGEYNRNALLLENAGAKILHRRPSPFAVIRIKLMKGIHYWVTAEYDAALQTLSEGIEVSRENGVRLFDSLMWSFRTAAETARNNTEMAEESLKNQLTSLLDRQRTLDVFFYHVNSAWHALLAENPSLAAENLQAVSASVTEIGTPYYRALWHIGMALAAFLQGDVKDAKAHAQRAHRISLTMKSHVMEWYSLLISAYFLLQEEAQGRQGLQSLRRGLSLGRKYGYTHLEFYQPSIMQFLCAKALEKGIEQEYVKKLVRRLMLPVPKALTPEVSDLHLESWPYLLRIYTLGRFEIVKNDEPLVFAGKVQKKPLEMLKAVIAFGGTNVPEDRVIDALWPDADGDLAHKSFETTLARLRRLLGGNDFIRCSAGQISIDPVRCWVDSLALEQVLGKIRRAADQTAQLWMKAASLHQGPFLPADTNFDWALSRRETLKNGLLHATFAAGSHHEYAGHWQTAVNCYLQGMDADHLSEELYRRLMACYAKLGDRAAAVKTYKRCRAILQAELGVDPSAETQAVYSSIVEGL